MTALKLRILFDGAMIGPGKAALLDGIAATGSIAAAGRQMQMSYKRAWMLVETMNAAFAAPLVDSSRGGTKGGGAHLTETGQAVLMHFRALEAKALAAGGAEIIAIRALVSDMSGQK